MKYIISEKLDWKQCSRITPCGIRPTSRAVCLPGDLQHVTDLLISISSSVNQGHPTTHRAGRTIWRSGVFPSCLGTRTTFVFKVKDCILAVCLPDEINFSFLSILFRPGLGSQGVCAETFPGSGHQPPLLPEFPSPPAHLGLISQLETFHFPFTFTL